MPRKPKSLHPLRVLRTALGASQERFADQIGLSASYINAIECSGKPTPDEVASTVELVYGVDLHDSRFGKALDPDDQVQLLSVACDILGSIRFYGAERDALNSDVQLAQEVSGAKLNSLLAASAKHGKAVAVLHSFERWLNEMREHLGTATAAALSADIRERKKARKFVRDSPWLPEEIDVSRVLFMMSRELRHNGVDLDLSSPPLPDHLLQMAQEFRIEAKDCRGVVAEIKSRKAKALTWADCLLLVKNRKRSRVARS